MHFHYICSVNKNSRTMSFELRLKQAITNKGYSKSDLANIIGVHYSQIGRYENKGAQPSAEVLGKLANILIVSVDFLLSSDTDKKELENLTHIEVLRQYKELDKQPEEERKTVILGVSALFRNYKARFTYTS